MKKGQTRIEYLFALLKKLYRDRLASIETKKYFYRVTDSGAYLTLWSIDKKAGTANRDLEIFLGYERKQGDPIEL